MRRVRTLGLFAAVVTAVGASAATSASAALPEFAPPFPNPFTSKSGKSVIETVGKVKIECAADTNAGEITGPKTGIVVIKFTGCKLVPGGFVCTTPGAAAGEIVTKPLLITLGYINKAKKEVGVDLSSPAGGPLAEFACGEVRVLIVGSVIGKVTPVNKLVKPPAHFTLKFTQAKGKQKPPKLEGEPVDVLKTSLGGPFEESGLSSTDEIKFLAPTLIAA